MLPHIRFALNALVSEIQIKIYILPLCSIFSHSGHLAWLDRSLGTFFKQDTPMMIMAKFGSVVSEEKIFVKVNDDGRQVMRKAHLALRPR